MKIYLIVLFGILILLTSCNKKSNSGIKIPNATTEQSIKNDSLFDLLKSDLYRIAFHPGFDHEERVHTDTSKTITFDKTKIIFYRESNWEEIISANILNSHFVFLDSIIIGTQKKLLESRIKSVIKSDKIKIGNLNNTNIFIFKFEDDYLNSIQYKGSID